jgi:hypothetical protein
VRYLARGGAFCRRVDLEPAGTRSAARSEARFDTLEA